MSDNHKDLALAYHADSPSGKLMVLPSKRCQTPEDLALAYTPGVAEPCLRIQENPEDAYLYTSKGNTIAVITNGTAVLGLGNLGALASKPVMEGKAVLFKRFADVDAVDVEVDCSPGVNFVDVVEAISPTYGGINLEDIKAPECFDIESRLKASLNIPVFHDDQHGTAVVIAAGLLNALILAGKKLEDVRIVVNGAGAAAFATVFFLRYMGVHREQFVVCDTQGVIDADRDFTSAPHKLRIASITKARTLEQALVGADVFIGLSAANVVSPEMLMGMAKNPIVFALSNPDPEIAYDLAKATRPDAIVCTGRSDTPNQINNVLAFPYLFRAALDVRATKINNEMMAAASNALAELARNCPVVPFGPDSVIPNPFDERLFWTVPTAVAAAANETGIGGVALIPAKYEAQLKVRGKLLLERLTRA
ncbi:MAG: malate dehydrogenase [Armatimonadetes bacterium]|nr:malate dehydrogenase [Armatimonadota bacterium]